jgi:hypothetical protein
MNEIYQNTHKKCAHCLALFPKSWLQAKMAFQVGENYFCSEGCKNRFAAKAVLQKRVLPARFGGQTSNPQSQGIGGFFWAINH